MTGMRRLKSPYLRIARVLAGVRVPQQVRQVKRSVSISGYGRRTGQANR